MSTTGNYIGIASPLLGNSLMIRRVVDGEMLHNSSLRANVSLQIHGYDQDKRLSILEVLTNTRFLREAIQSIELSEANDAV
tara:strand:+ start:1140 stop:1382 length:243 start_codon:yes stop_codon:yes gene_type:complete